MGCVVLRDQTNNETSNSSHGNTGSRFPRMKSKHGVSDGSLKIKATWEVHDGYKVDSGDHEDRCCNQLNLEGTFNFILSLDSLEVSCNEGREQTDKDTNGRNDNGENHGVPSSSDANGRSDNKCSTGRLGERSKQVRAHTSDISDVVTNVVGNSGGVSWIILGNSVNDLSDQISTNISSLGVNTSTDTSKHGNDGSTQSISSNAFRQMDPLIR
mmetsp:Transcript_3062/g.4215  ORF Transcript_3062/g.4215 Transcript_3062/m.4215 type:complete len:213 (-) Transcript_3062:250-888(-)